MLQCCLDPYWYILTAADSLGSIGNKYPRMEEGVEIRFAIELSLEKVTVTGLGGDIAQDLSKLVNGLIHIH